MTALARMGFDAAKLGFAGRTAAAACVALWLAWRLGLEHPQWAAMSVWAASQPLRGQVLEKSFFRFAGTVSGTVAGVALVQASVIHPALLVAGLALWVAACTGIGNLQRGFVGYGTVLAGYTAAMVALLDAGHPQNVWHLGLDRMATVLTGVAVATVAGLIFARGAPHAALRAQVRALVADLLAHLAAEVPDARAAEALLGRLAAVEEALDPHAAGSRRSRQEIRATRAVLIAAIAVLLQRDRAGAAAAPLGRAAEALQAGQAGAARAALAEARAVAPAMLAEALADLGGALAVWAADPGAPAAAAPAVPPVILHRDWIGAREAGLRALAAILLVGTIWLVTGWAAGNFMLLGLSVMISIFSTFESPVQIMRWVVLGQIAGILGVLACRWLVWPQMTGEAGLIAAMMPFVMLGSLLTAHRRTAAVSFDYNMVFLLLLQPHWPLTGTVAQSLAMAVAVVAAPLVAWGMYLAVFPAHLRRRIDTLGRMMRRDLADLARDPGALAHRAVWRARLYHRVMRLIGMSGRSGRALDQAAAQGLAVLEAGQVILRLHRRLAEPGLSPREARACRHALSRAAQIESRPAKGYGALARAEARLGPVAEPL